MSAGLRNGTGVRTHPRPDPFASFGQNSSFELSSNSVRNPGFAASKSGWDKDIWGNGGLSHKLSTGTSVDSSDTDLNTSTSRPTLEGKTGSSSLLPASESDDWNGNQGASWSSANAFSTQNGPSSSHVSPTKLRQNDRSTALPLDNTRSNSPFRPRDTFSERSGSIPSGAFPSEIATNGYSNHSRSGTTFSATNGANRNNEEDRRPFLKPSNFTTSLGNSPFQMENTSMARRSDLFSNARDFGSERPSFSRAPPSLLSNSQSRPTGSMPMSHYNRDSFSVGSRDHFLPASDRPFPPVPTDESLYPTHQGQDLTPAFSQMTIRAPHANNRQSSQISRRPRFGGHSPSPYNLPSNQNVYQATADDSFNDLQEGFLQESMGFQGSFSGNALNTSTTYDQDRAMEEQLSSPGMSSSGLLPPRDYPTYYTSDFARPANRRNPSGLQTASPDSSSSNVSAQQPRAQYDYQYNITPQQALANPGLKYYPLSQALYGSFPNAQVLSRYPNADGDIIQQNRSPLLREFRATFKTRQWELKEIYNHVVEFCGDQHGSRMIQERLETANGDDKERVFLEVLPSVVQIMMDIFGNYVIQKLFEHGNQVQKKGLADNLKTRVKYLTVHVYGCRVVQKALERVLPEQQCSLIHELDRDVIECVKDQNGNHVIQKAIEWVPSEDLQPIVNAVLKDVKHLAFDKFGCRVVQRMLEHCKQPVCEQITRDLRQCIPHMISHQYGNYVIQNILANGPEEDRRLVTDEVTSKLLMYCKNKFASNVVEKALEHAPTEQRAEIVRRLTVQNEKGESPIVALADDNFGNYVIQKVWKDLPTTEQDRLANQMKQHISHMRKMGCGAKPIAAIEKLIYDGERGQERKADNDRALSQSSASTSETSSLLPSTNASTVEGPIGDEASDVTITVSPQKTFFSPNQNARADANLDAR